MLWWLSDSPHLDDRHRDLIADPDNTVLVSAISIADVAIKMSLGKLVAPEHLSDTVVAEGFDLLPLTATHAEALRWLPWHHRDPFDRMLVAQASVEGIPLLSADKRLREYDIICI